MKNNDQPKIAIWILWRIWKSRNQLVYGRQQSSWQMDLKHAKQEAQEWTLVLYKNKENCGVSPTGMVRRYSQWHKPIHGYVKINYDGSRRLNMSIGR